MMEVKTEYAKNSINVRDLNKFLANIIDGIADAITATNTNGEIIYWNSAAEELFGYKSEEMIGKHIFEIVPEDRRMELREVWKEVYRKGFVKGYETERVTRDGERVPVEITISAIKEGSRLVGYSAVFHDIRKRKKIEKKLIELSNFNKKIVQNAPVGILVLDNNGNVLLANSKLIEIFNFHGIDGVPDRNMNIFELPLLNREIKDFLKKSLEGKEIQFEKEYTYVDGKKAYFTIKCVPLYDENRIEGIIAIVEDTTEKKKLEKELRESHEKLKKAYMELKSLDELKSDIIANVSHELKTPITIIKGFIELVMHEDNKEKRNMFLEKAKEAVMRQNSIVDDLISISRVERGKFSITMEKFDLEKVIEECIRKKEEFAKRRNVKIYKEIDGPCVVIGDRIEIMHVILNLLDNAIKFNKDRGEVIIKVKKRKDKAMVSIEDTGVGIPKDKIDKIFEPLTQLDPKATRKYGGTGTGLAVAKKIIEMHNSEIEVESELGVGSKFYFMLPLVSLEF